MDQPASPPSYNSLRPRRRGVPRRLAQALVVLAVGGAIYAGFFRHTSSGPGGPAPIAVKVTTVTEAEVPLTLHAVGNVVTYQSVAIRSRVDSQIVAVHFKDGDEVKQGDLLFELDDKSLRARAAELEANIARDRAQLENARRQRERTSALTAKGFATKATSDDANAAVAVAEATLNASIAALEDMKVQIGYCRITAPIAGRTGTINVTLGNNVKANDTTPLVTLNQLKPIRVQASLPQQQFDAVRSAMQQAQGVTVDASRQDDAGGAPIAQGTLEYIDNAVDASTGTFVTRAGFANEDERLLPGMFVNTTLNLGGSAQALTVPEVAVQHGQQGDYVFVVVEGKALKREVTVARLNHGVAAIAKGLSAGETVVVDGLMNVKDGSPVTVNAAAPVAASS